MRCPKCKNKVLQKSGSTTTLRTHGKVIFTEAGQCQTQCHWCKEPVTIPLQIQDGTPIETETFILSK